MTNYKKQLAQDYTSNQTATKMQTEALEYFIRAEVSIAPNVLPASHDNCVLACDSSLVDSEYRSALLYLCIFRVEPPKDAP